MTKAQYCHEKKTKQNKTKHPYIRTYLCVEANVACGETHDHACPVRLACGTPKLTNTCIYLHTVHTVLTVVMYTTGIFF